MPFEIVIPTIGRSSLSALLDSLESSPGALPERIVIVDDRRNARAPLCVGARGQRLADRIAIVRGRALGPAAARNTGWQNCSEETIAFLDDDVVVDQDWLRSVERDLRALGPSDAGSQGQLRVPLPHDRLPTDWERNVAALERSSWITADMIYRRSVLQALGGFDERFTRAYREDSDFALRVFRHGWNIVCGTRSVQHPVRPADRWISVRLQAGNADDALMRALHGPDWRERAEAPPGRLPEHALTVICAATAAASFCAWLGLYARFAWHRIAAGPKTRQEIATVLITSPIIPFAAIYHALRGTQRARSIRRHAA